MEWISEKKVLQREKDEKTEINKRVGSLPLDKSNLKWNQ